MAQNPEVREQYEAQALEFAIAQKLISEKLKAKFTQKK